MQDMDSQTLPEISVLMCVYNGDVFLTTAIESILAQTFSDFEFIIVDDGSTDKTSELLSAYAVKDRRIHLITNEENLGLTKSLNIGLGAARGKYVARMDADDIALTDRFMIQYWFMEEHPSLAVLGSAVDIIGEKGRKIGERRLAISYEEIKSKMLFNNQFIHSTLFFRTDILKALGGYNEDFKKSQDYELMFRISDKYPVANLPEKLLQFRFHTNSLSWISSQQQTCGIRARFLAIQKYHYPKLQGIAHIFARCMWLLIPKKIKILYSQKKNQKVFDTV